MDAHAKAPENIVVDYSGFVHSTAPGNTLKPVNETLEQIQKNKKIMCLKLQKRMLRAKVQKLVDRHMDTFCSCVDNYEKKIVDLDNRLQEHKKKQLENLLHKSESSTSLHTKRLNFSRYDSKEYIPTVKACALHQRGELNLKSSMAEHDDRQKYIRVIAQVCKSLTSREILEIGEDPGYFFVQEKYKRNDVLFDSSLWTSFADFQRDKDQGSQINRSKVDSSFYKSSRQQTEIDQLEDQILGNEKYQHTKTQVSQASILEKVKLKQKRDQEELQELKREHRRREERWKQKQEQIIQQMNEKQEHMISKYNKKIDYLYNIREQKHRNREQILKESQHQQQQLFEKLLNKKYSMKDDNDIFLMNIQLRRLLMENQVKKNIIKSNEEKIKLKQEKQSQFYMNQLENMQKQSIYKQRHPSDDRPKPSQAVSANDKAISQIKSFTNLITDSTPFKNIYARYRKPGLQ